MAEASGAASSARPRAAGLGRAGVLGALLCLSVLLLAGQPSAETPGTTSRESVVTGTTDGDADGPSVNPAISADGRWVAFESDATNLTDDPGEEHRRIFLRDRETLETTVVSLGPDGAPIHGDARNPSVSADGRYVAFDAEVNRPPVELLDWRTQLELLAYSVPVADGTSMIRIAGNLGQGVSGVNLLDADRDDDADPVFSPDRRMLAFTRGGEIWVRGLDPSGFPADPPPRRLTDAPDETFTSDQPAWSPDGQRIVFRRATPEGGLQGDPIPGLGSGLFVVDVRTGEETRLTDSGVEPDADAWPDWSPDGRWIAFSRSTRVAPDDFVVRRVFALEVFHDDGDVLPGDLSQITDGAFDDIQPRWHPWRETLAFARIEASGGTRDGPGPGPRRAIWLTDIVPEVVVDAAGARPQAGDVAAAAFVIGVGERRLTGDEGNDSRPAWTGEGLGVTFVSDRNGETDADLYRVPLDPGLEVDGDVELVSGGSGPISLPPGVTQSPHHAPVNLGLATPAGAQVRVLGAPLGPPPEGRVRFEVFPCQDPEGVGCTPDEARRRQVGGLAPLVDGGAETPLRTSGMTPPYDYGGEPDFHCLAADYSGDSFYRSTRLLDADEGCFLMGRAQPTIELEPMDGSFGGLIARFGAPGAAPTPTGIVAFFLCGPDPDTTAAGCVEGGEQVDWVEPLDDGVGDVFAPSELPPGRYCWRVEYAGDFDYHPLRHTDGSSACFVAGDALEPVLSGRIVHTGEAGPGATLNARFGVSDDNLDGAPPGRGLVWLCGPEEAAPEGCVTGGAPVGAFTLEADRTLYTVDVGAELTQQLGTHCFRLDYRWEEGADPAEQEFAERSHTNARSRTTDTQGLCFDVLDDGFDDRVAVTGVFRHDRDTGVSELVSVALDGVADGDSYDPSISGDGQRVAFTSEAINLTEDCQSALADERLCDGEDVFVRDLGVAPPATTLVSVRRACPDPDEGCFGDSGQPSISADGGFVAFTTNAFHIDVVNPPDPDFLIGEFTQVVVRDLAAGTSSVESLGSDGQAGFGNSFEPSISADGSRVAFTSDADDLVRDDDDLFFDDVFVRDRADGITYLASIAEQDAELADGPSGEPSISTDGRTVAFSSFATNLVPDHPCAGSELSGCPRSEVFVNPEVGAAGLLSVDPDGNGVEEPWHSGAPAVAGIGRFVAFESENPELVPGDGNELSDVFVRDRTPVLVLTPDPLDLGPALVGEASDVGTLVGVNAGSGPLEVAGVALTAGDVADFTIEATDCTGAVLLRTETCTVDVRFTPQGQGPRSAVLTVDSSDPEGPRQVTLTGVGTRALAAVDPDPVDFGGRPVGTVSSPRVVTFTSVGSAPVTVGSVALAGANPDDFTIEDDDCSGQTVASLEGCSVIVRFEPSAAGPRTAALAFTDTAEASPRSVTLVGEGLAPIAEVTPDPVDFGEQFLATTSDPRVVTLVNAFPDLAASQPPTLTASDVSLTGTNPGDFLIEDGCTAEVLDPGGGCQVVVRFSPGALGTRTALLVFTDNAEGSPRSVTLQGVGIAPDVPVGLLEVSDPVDFGVAAAGEGSQLRTITVSSTGTAPVDVTTLALAGADAGQFVVPAEGDGCSQSTLAPGARCGIAVVYRPQVTGAHRAALAVASNAVGAPHEAGLAGLAPLLEPDPPLGPPGFVTEVTGADFPPNTTLTIAWEPGIGSRPVVTDDSGSFRTFMLVLRRDLRGPRTVEARGDGFTIATDFLVVPGTLQPGEFASRR